MHTAKVAGVGEIIMVSPGNKQGLINKTVLAAVTYRVLKFLESEGHNWCTSFGTKQISKVDVISGPGNIYVTTAKKLIYGSTGIIP